MVDYPFPLRSRGSIARETASPGKYSIETIPICAPAFTREKKERNDSEAGDFFGEEVRSRKKEGEDGEKKDGEEDWGSGRE